MQNDKNNNDYFDRYTDAEPIQIGLKEYAKVIGAGLFSVVVLMYLRMNSVYSLYHKLSDSCFLIATIFIFVGIISYANQDGFFDSAGFTFRKFIEIKRIFKSSTDKGEKLSYYKYKESKDKKRGRGFKHHYLVVGGVFLLAAILFLYLNKM